MPDRASSAGAGNRGGDRVDEPEASGEDGDQLYHQHGTRRAVPFGDQDGHGYGAAAQREVRHERLGVVVGFGGLQRAATVAVKRP